MNKVHSPWGLEELDTIEQLTLSTSRFLAREVGDGLSMGVPHVPWRPCSWSWCACQSSALYTVGSSLRTDSGGVETS